MRKTTFLAAGFAAVTILFPAGYERNCSPAFGASANASDANSNDSTKFNLKLPDGNNVVIDAQKLALAPDYKLTVGFVAQFDPPKDNMTPIQKKLREARARRTDTDEKEINLILKHIKDVHGVSKEQVEAVRQHCIKILARPKQERALVRGLEM